MLPDRVSNPGLLTYESCALLTALRGPAPKSVTIHQNKTKVHGSMFRMHISSRDKKKTIKNDKTDRRTDIQTGKKINSVPC